MDDGGDGDGDGGNGDDSGGDGGDGGGDGDEMRSVSVGVVVQWWCSG